MDPVLLAIRDHDLRVTLRLLLQMAGGYRVVEAHNGTTMFTAIHTSPSPLVVVLDAHLEGLAAAEQLLRLAAAGGPTGRHRYVLCTRVSAERLPPSLVTLLTTLGVPVLSMPFGPEESLRLVAHAQAMPPIAVRPTPMATTRTVSGALPEQDQRAPAIVRAAVAAG
jgi:CheY-like chemotaxis protein